MNASKGKPVVSIVRVEEQDTYSALTRGVDLIGGIEDVIRRGSRVLVKPNFTIAPTERGITNPVVIEAVLRLVSAMGPREVIVGEGAGASYTWGAFRVYNIYDMATRYGARVVDLNVDEGVRREVPPETGREYVMLPRTVVESDVVVSVPMFKLWGENPMSLSLKNLFGHYGARYYGHIKESREFAASQPERVLEGEVGTELGAHQPSIPHSIAAVNLARPSDLTVIDALEGSDGQGNFIRLDLLMVGKNALATDCVAMAVAGLNSEEHEQFRFCSRMGLGPCRLEEIEVQGEPIEEVRFPLTRLRDNVLELPLKECLRKVSLGELEIMANALKMYGFLAQDDGIGTTREEITANLLRVMTESDYFQKAVERLPRTGRALLRIIAEHGGTSGSFPDLEARYAASQRDIPAFWVALRSLMRLGLAFLLHGQAKSYVVLAEGVADAARA